MLYISSVRLRDMKNTKPLVREAYRVAANDMLPEIKKLREESKYKRYDNSYTLENRSYDESWVVSVSELYSVEIRRMNAELGLNTLEGINQWYKN